MLSTTEAARLLSLDRTSISRYCRQERIKAIKAGRDWRITEEEIERFRDAPRPTGRPRKENRAPER